MDLDDLIWELNEEKKRCAEGAKIETLTPEMKGFFLGEANYLKPTTLAHDDGLKQNCRQHGKPQKHLIRRRP